MTKNKKRTNEKKLSRSPDVGFGIFKNHEAEWVVNRTLTFMNEKAAEIGECLHTAKRIAEQDETDIEIWIKEWAKLAARVENDAKKALKAGHLVSAKELFLRASNYYRTAEYCCPPDHPRFEELWRKAVDSFQLICNLFEPEIQIIEINFEGKSLPGYFWLAKNDGKTYPTLIAVGGNDSSLEELVYWTGMAAHRRGYNFFAFEHPGHRGAVHLYSDCIKRPDFEKPYKVAIDYLETLPGVDERLIMTGYSFGGFITCRVAAFEKRLKAIVPNPAIYHEPYTNPAWKGIWTKIPEKIIEKIVNKGMQKAPLTYSFVRYTLWTLGRADASLMDLGTNRVTGFSVKEHLSEIACPVLMLVGDMEGERWLEQAREFSEHISSEKKDIYIFSADKDGSNDHCQLDNRSRGNQIMFDWLDELFNYNTNKAE